MEGEVVGVGEGVGEGEVGREEVLLQGDDHVLVAVVELPQSLVLGVVDQVGAGSLVLVQLGFQLLLAQVALRQLHLAELQFVF